MTYHVNAIYENGVLKLEQPLPLKENERVSVIVHVRSSHADRSYGILEWKGSLEDLEYLAESPENSILAVHDNDDLLEPPQR